MTERGEAMVIGAGGHAKVVVATLQEAGYSVKYVFDDDRNTWGRNLLGVPVRGPVEKQRITNRLPTVIAVGDNGDRKSLADRLALNCAALVHPRAWVHPSVRLGPGTVVFAGAVLQPETVVGAHAIVNTGVVVDHDCSIGDYVHLAPGTCLAGGVRIEEGVFLGIRAVAIPGVRIGAWTRVGAGAVVANDLPDHVLAMGVPATVVREDRS